MNANMHAEENLTPATIEMLIARPGVWRILRAVAAALVRRERKALMVFDHELPDYMRRDIGLMPEPKSLRHWDVRL